MNPDIVILTPIATNIPSVSPITNLASGSSGVAFNIASDLYASLYSFFSSFNYALLRERLEIVGLILTIIFGVLLLITIINLRAITINKVAEVEAEIQTEFNLPKPSYDSRWEQVKNSVQSVNSSEWKIAVIEGDKYVDDALKKAGFHGESMGERLMLIDPGQLLSLQTLWDAHKLRNLIVHNADYQMAHRQAVLAVEAFEKVLRELGMLS